jgi:hypothetical protein
MNKWGMITTTTISFLEKYKKISCSPDPTSNSEKTKNPEFSRFFNPSDCFCKQKEKSKQ